MKHPIIINYIQIATSCRRYRKPIETNSRSANRAAGSRGGKFARWYLRCEQQDTIATVTLCWPRPVANRDVTRRIVFRVTWGCDRLCSLSISLPERKAICVATQHVCACVESQNKDFEVESNALLAIRLHIFFPVSMYGGVCVALKLSISNVKKRDLCVVGRFLDTRVNGLLRSIE